MINAFSSLLFPQKREKTERMKYYLFNYSFGKKNNCFSRYSGKGIKLLISPPHTRVSKSVIQALMIYQDKKK